MPSPSRRALLRAGGGLVATLAGCTRRSDGPGTSPGADSLPGTADPSTGTEPPATPTSARTPGPVRVDHRAVRWAYDVGSPVRNAPAVADGTLYVGGWRPTGGTPTPGYEPGPAESLLALDAATGTRRWRVRTEAPVQDTPTVGDGAVYAVTGWYGFHAAGFAVTAVAADGNRRFRFAPGLAYSSLTVLGVADGRVFVGTADDALRPEGETVYALDAVTGDVAWQAPAGDVGGGVARTDALYVAETGGVSARDPATGSERWAVAAGLVPGLLVTADAVYLADEGVRAVDPADGTELWRFAPDGGVFGGVTAGETVYVGTHGGAVVALSAADGTERWRADVGGAGPVRNLRSGSDAVYAAGDGTGVVALAATDGTERWRAERGTTPTLGPVVGDALLATGSDGRRVRSLSVAGGSERWVLEPDGDVGRPVAGEGLAYVGTGTGVVYAVEP